MTLGQIPQLKFYTRRAVDQRNEGLLVPLTFFLIFRMFKMPFLLFFFILMFLLLLGKVLEPYLISRIVK